MSDIISTIDDRLIDRLSNSELLDQYELAVECASDVYATTGEATQADEDAAEYRAEILTRMGC